MAQPKRNMTEYLRWRGDLDFSEFPVCEADFLVLSQLSYMPLDGIVPHEYECEITLGIIIPLIREKLVSGDGNWLFDTNENIEFLDVLLESPRYFSVCMCGFVNILNAENEEQFSAVTFRISDPEEKEGLSQVIAFRGTDSSLIGWKEDFNMAFSDAVPSQLDAVRYIENVSDAFPDGKLYVCGHSKGGNLAVYGSAFCDISVQNRIYAVRNLDGPGFLTDTTEKEGFRRILDRTVTVVPSSSVVGILLEHAEKFTVIKSYAPQGPFQHNPFSWQIDRCSYVAVEEISDITRYINETMSAWLKNMSPELREKFIDGVFDIVSQTGESDVRELFSGKNLVSVLRAMRNTDRETAGVLFDAFSVFKTAAGAALPALLERLKKQ